MRLRQANNTQLTSRQFARIARALAEPRRMRMIQEIASCPEQVSYAVLQRKHQVSAATFSHHTKELEVAGLVKIVRKGKGACLLLERSVLRRYIERLSKPIKERTDFNEPWHVTERTLSESAKAVVRRNTQEVQGKGRFEVFEELFANDFVDHTTQPGTGMTPDKVGVRRLYASIRKAFPDFHAEIHWQLADEDFVTTYKTYYGTHEGPFLGIAPTRRKIHFESVDVMRVQNGKITDHWGVGNLLSLMQQIGGWTPRASTEVRR